MMRNGKAETVSATSREQFKPRDYQRRAVQFALEHPRCNLWIEPGLGKTVITLTLVDLLPAFGDSNRTLVLAPLRVARDVWPAEALKWAHLTGLSVTPILGSAAQRKRLLSSSAPIHAINYENVPWLLEYLGDEWPYDVVVCDESTKIKSHKSVRFAGVTEQEDEAGNVIPAKPGLQDVASKAKRWINLTGTPAPLGIGDLWSQTYVLDWGRRLGKNITAFRNRWMQMGRTVHQWNPLPHADAEVRARLADITLTLRAQDYLDLPPLIENIVEVTLPDDARALYKQMANNFVMELEAGQVTAANVAVKAQKLMQVCSGAAYTGDDGQWEAIHDAKLDALDDLLEESGEPVIVVYQYKSELARLKDRYPQARELKSTKDQDDWNAKRIPILLIHPASAGHGLSLQYGGRTMVTFSLTWDLEQDQQVIERIGPTRQVQAGLGRPVFLHRLVAVNTIDEVVLERLRTKADVQELLKLHMRKA